MKIHIVGNWEFELIPENKREENLLRRTYDKGHLHFVCKALTFKARRKWRRLLLTPSCFAFKMIKP
jgi:hypothetical protein